jgi:prevent-host-death family protein
VYDYSGAATEREDGEGMEARQYIDSSNARNGFTDVVNRVSYGHERLVVRRHGRDAAALISMEDLELLERAIEEAEDRIDVAEAERILADPTEERIARRRRRS